MKRHGFSLLELLLTISIATILITVGLPSFSHLLKRHQSTLTANQLLGVLIYARQSAVDTGITITVCPSADHTSCGSDWSKGLLVFRDDNRDGERNDDERLLRSFYPPDEEGTLRWSSFGSNRYLRFTPEGFTDNQNGSFIYCPKDKNNQYGRVIVVSRSGRARSAKDSNGNGVVENSQGRDMTC